MVEKNEKLKKELATKMSISNLMAAPLATSMIDQEIAHYLKLQ